MESLQAVISGVQFFSFAKEFLDKFFVPIARSLEGIPWLMPNSFIFGSKTLVSTPSKSYTANDYQELFGKIGYTNGYQFFQRTQHLLVNFPNPNVNIYCFCGTNVPTPSQYIYKKDFSPGVSTIRLTPTVVKGAGDGTVNIESLRVCQKWSGHGMVYKEFSGISHLNMVKNTAVLDDIAKIVKAPKKKSWSWG